LKASQLRSVAERHFKDAQFLLSSGKNEHANGAIYMGGFVLECLLKAKLLEKYSWLGQKANLNTRNLNEQVLYGLCYRSHDLEAILTHLPEVLARRAKGRKPGGRLDNSLIKLCSEWTLFARHSSLKADIQEARDFVTRVEEVKAWLR